MAYGGRGRCVGRIMSVLYRVTHHSDRWCFGDSKITSGPKGSEIGTLTWRAGTDIPEFHMTHPDYQGRFWDDRIARAYEELAAADARQGWLSGYSADTHRFERYVRSQLDGHLVHTYLRLVDTSGEAVKPQRSWQIETHPQHDWHLDMRLQFFEQFPLDMKIVDGDNEIGTVADMMKYEWREDIDGPRRVEVAA